MNIRPEGNPIWIIGIDQKGNPSLTCQEGNPTLSCQTSWRKDLPKTYLLRVDRPDSVKLELTTAELQTIHYDGPLTRYEFGIKEDTDISENHLVIKDPLPKEIKSGIPGIVNWQELKAELWGLSEVQLFAIYCAYGNLKYLGIDYFYPGRNHTMNIKAIPLPQEPTKVAYRVSVNDQSIDPFASTAGCFINFGANICGGASLEPDDDSFTFDLRPLSMGDSLQRQPAGIELSAPYNIDITQMRAELTKLSSDRTRPRWQEFQVLLRHSPLTYSPFISARSS